MTHLAGLHLASITPKSRYFVVDPIPSVVFAMKPKAPTNGATIRPVVPLATPFAKPDIPPVFAPR